MYRQKNYSLNEILDKILNWYYNLNVIQQAIVGVIVLKIIRDLSPKTYYSPKPKAIPRKDFSDSIKKSTLMIQGNVCNSCKNSTIFWDFHHKDGNSSNNRPSNCEALCPNCHAEKTRQKL